LDGSQVCGVAARSGIRDILVLGVAGCVVVIIVTDDLIRAIGLLQEIIVRVGWGRQHGGASCQQECD
jgi:SpoU rRNA methylase family enzyme